MSPKLPAACHFSVGQCALPWSVVQAPDRGLPAPDLVLYLDIPLEVAEQRGGYGQERYEKREMQQQVRRLFAGRCGMVQPSPRLVEVTHCNATNCWLCACITVFCRSLAPVDTTSCMGLWP